MRKVAISLLLLCPSLVSSQPLQLSPETRLADFTYGGVVTAIPTIVASGAGFTAYVNVDNTLFAIPVGSDGKADLPSRTSIGPAAQVVMSAGKPLLFWTENGSVVAARLNGDGSHATPTVVMSDATLQRAGCDDHSCLVSFFTGGAIPSVIVTDAEGHRLTNATQLPDFTAALQNVNAIAPDAHGFTLYRGGTIFVPQRLVRVDRTGTVIYDAGTLAAFLTVRLVPVEDHVVVIAQAQVNGEWFVSGMNVSSTDGTLSPPRQLVKLASQFAPFTIESRSGNYLLAVTNGQHVALFNVDAGVTTAAPAGSFDLPSNMTLAGTASNGSSTIAMLGSTTFFTVGTASFSTPSVISYGPLHQQPRGIVSVGSDFLVMWSEVDTVSALETLHAVFLSSSGVPRNGSVLGPSLATNVLPLTTVGTDTLALWYNDDQRRSRGAIIHADGTADPVTFGASIAARAIAPTEGDWIVFAVDGSSRLVTLRVSRTASVSAPTPLVTTLSVVFGLASDGSKILLLVPTESIVLSKDLKIEQRHGMPFNRSGSLAFSRDTYLFADGQNLMRLDANGVVQSQVALASSLPAVIARPNGWALFNTSSVTLVFRADPPIVGVSVSLPGIDVGPLVAAADTIGLLYARDSAVYFRTIEFGAPPRRRAIGSR
jgi:hypothetical protein